MLQYMYMYNILHTPFYGYPLALVTVGTVNANLVLLECCVKRPAAMPTLAFRGVPACFYPSPAAMFVCAHLGDMELTALRVSMNIVCI